MQSSIMRHHFYLLLRRILVYSTSRLELDECFMVRSSRVTLPGCRFFSWSGYVFWLFSRQVSPVTSEYGSVERARLEY